MAKNCHFGYLDCSKYVLAMVFTIMHVGRVFVVTTMYFMEILWENDHFFEIWGPFEPSLGTQNMRCFSPALFYVQWLTVTSFNALTYIIHKKYHFLPKFSPNGGNFGYLDFSKYVFTEMYVGRVFWETTIYFMALKLKNDHIFLI